MTVVIRSADGADLDAIMAIERASFPSDAWSLDTMRQDIASPFTTYLAAVDDDAVIAYAGLRAPAGSPDGDVQTIAVAASARGTGLGRRILRALIAEADERRVRSLFLEVRADNDKAQQLYLSEGFVELARRPRYYQPDDVDALVMQLDVPAWRVRARNRDGSAA